MRLLKIIFVSMLSDTLLSTKFKPDMKTCELFVMNINMSLYESVVFSTTRILDNNKTYHCNIVLNLSSNFSILYDNILSIFLDTFVVENPKNDNSFALFRLSTRSRILLEIKRMAITKTYNSFLITPVLMDKGFNWSESLYVDIDIYHVGIWKFNLIITIMFNCALKDGIKCFHYSTAMEYCLPKSLRCDKQIYCPMGNLDEAKKTCYPNVLDSIIVPFIIITVIIIIILWILYKMLPCIFHLRRVSNPRAMSLTQNLNRFRFIFAASVAASTSGANHRPSLEFSDAKTPNSLIYCPPKYTSDLNSVSDNRLPPSYSHESDIKVYPSFFKRFFGETPGATRLNVPIQESNKDTSKDYSRRINNDEQYDMNTLDLMDNVNISENN